MKALRQLLLCALVLLVSRSAGAQIVNRLRVDQDTFLRYAYGRMQQFNPTNLALADSLYTAGEAQGNRDRGRCV